MSASTIRDELKAYLSGLGQSAVGAWSDQLAGSLRPLLEAAEQRAAMTQWFNPGELWRQVGPSIGTPDGEWLSALRRSCLVDVSDASRWRMLDEQRLRLLSALQVEGTLVGLAAEVARSSRDRAPQLIVSMLNNDFDLDDTPSSDLLQASEISDWLREASVPAELPSAELIGATLELRARDAELASLSEEVIGRESELRAMTSFLRQAWRGRFGTALPVLRLEGIGGIGKSTMAAHFVRHGLPEESGEPVVIWIDYDKLRIHPDDLNSVMAELSRQFAWSLPDRAAALREARAAMRPEQPGDPEGPIAYDEMETKAAVDTLSAALTGHHRATIDRPVLIVLDTFEQVERLPDQVANLLETLAKLQFRALPRLALLVCGRAVFSRGFGTTQVHSVLLPFSGLSAAASYTLLTGPACLAPKDAKRFLGAFDDLIDGEDDTAFRSRVGLPMLLMLIGRLSQEGRIRLDSNDLVAIREAADGEMAAAYVYDRVLAQVPEDLRALAHPGLVLSEVSARLVAEVIWPVVHPDRPGLDEHQARDLLERLSRETWLVEPVIGSDPPRFRHRTDLRRAMLTKMIADRTSGLLIRVLRLHRRAMDWHQREQRRSVGGERAQHRAARVYHALQLSALGVSGARLSLTAIREARDELVLQMEDFPADFRPVVQGLLGGDLSVSELDRLHPRLRTSLIAALTANDASRGDADAGLAFVGMLDPEDRVLTPAIARNVIKLFLQSGRWSSARDLMAPLVSHPSSKAFIPYLRKPALSPLLAAHILRRDEVIADIVDDGVASYDNGRTADRYEVFGALFAQLRGPTPAGRHQLLVLLRRLVVSFPAHRAAGDNLRLVNILASLVRDGQLDPRDSSSFAASLRRGAHVVGISTVLHLRQGGHSSRSMAQWLSACRSFDRRFTMDGLPDPYTPLVTLFEDFHSPLANALADCMHDKESSYRVASLAWELSAVRPHDLRPSLFGETCASEAGRRSVLPGLVAFMDRSGKLEEFLLKLPTAVPVDGDLETVRAVTLRWIGAFGPLSTQQDQFEF